MKFFNPQARSNRTLFCLNFSIWLKIFRQFPSLPPPPPASETSAYPFFKIYFHPYNAFSRLPRDVHYQESSRLSRILLIRNRVDESWLKIDRLAARCDMWRHELMCSPVVRHAKCNPWRKFQRSWLIADDVHLWSYIPFCVKCFLPVLNQFEFYPR